MSGWIQVAGETLPLLDVPRILAALPPVDLDGRAGGIGMNRRSFLGGVLSTGWRAASSGRRRAGPGRRDPDRHERRVPRLRGRSRERAPPGRPGLLQRDQRTGRSLRAVHHGVALDDGYNPDPCIRNTIQLLDGRRCSCSPTTWAPRRSRARCRHQAVRGPARSAGRQLHRRQPQREAPYVDQVFNVRASYRQEWRRSSSASAGGARRFGVYYQIDAYGRSGTDGVARPSPRGTPRSSRKPRTCATPSSRRT